MTESKVVYRDSNIYKEHMNDWSDEKLYEEKFSIDHRLEEAQKEYFDIDTEVEKKMELQFVCNHLINLTRAVHHQITKRQLDKAFTPKIKEMLSDSVKKQIES